MSTGGRTGGRQRGAARFLGAWLQIVALIVFGITSAGVGLIATAARGDSGPVSEPPGSRRMPINSVTYVEIQLGHAPQPTPSTSLPPPPSDRYDPHGRMYTDELRNLLMLHAPAYARELEAIGTCESGRWDSARRSWYVRPGAIGDAGNSLGWLQIWRGWPPGLGLELDPFDPVDAIHLAVAIREVRGRWGGGGGWTCADLLGVW